MFHILVQIATRNVTQIPLVDDALCPNNSNAICTVAELSYMLRFFIVLYESHNI